MKDVISKSISTTFSMGGKVKLNPSWNTKNVICPNDKLYYVLDGEIAVETESGKLVAKAGDMIIVPAGKKHDYYLTESEYAEKFWMHFSLLLDGKSFFGLYDVSPIVHVGLDKKIIETFSELIRRSSEATISDTVAVNALTCGVVSCYLDKATITERTVESDDVSRAVAYIQANYRNAITVADLAKISNLHPNYFIRKFKEQTRFSPIKYLNVFRMEMAKFMLQNSDLPIGTIMERVGIFDAVLFSKSFNSVVGCSPKKYREIYGSNPFNSNKITGK